MKRLIGATIAKALTRYDIGAMKITLAACLTLCVLSTATAPLRAASSDWHHVEGGAIRLVESAAPAEDGSRRAALEIKLNPGWKTYWQDPGSSGVPPIVSTMQGGVATTAKLQFPTPKWFDDEYGDWAGYDDTVTIAVSLERSSEPVGTPTKANVFLGICETICIPVHVDIVVDKGLNQAVAADEQIVAAAFDALPAPAAPALHLRIADIADRDLLAEAIVPEHTRVTDLFVAGTDTVTFGAPTRHAERDIPTYTINVRGATKPGDVFDYTLVTSDGAVHGQLQIP